MKYPVELTIRGYTYKVEYLMHHREVDRDFESDDYLGTVDSKTIRVLATVPLSQIVETLIHEALHALFTRNKMLKTALRANMEEMFINTLAADITRLLFDSRLVNLPKKPPITTRIVPGALP